MHRIIFHIDVNSAFLCWCAVDRLLHGETLDIRTIPAIIGGDSATRHGVGLAKSVPAKAYKIVTGEPVANAVLTATTKKYLVSFIRNSFLFTIRMSS